MGRYTIRICENGEWYSDAQSNIIEVILGEYEDMLRVWKSYEEITAVAVIDNATGEAIQMWKRSK